MKGLANNLNPARNGSKTFVNDEPIICVCKWCTAGTLVTRV